jgi:hypothetical protein
MKLTNLTRFVARWGMGLEPSGRELVVVVVKATFTIPKPGKQPEMAEKPMALVDADVFSGEAGRSSTLYESDFAPRKPRCDILLNGTAYAPSGRPATVVPVAMRVGRMTKAFNVVGRRFWIKPVTTCIPSHAEPFVKQPISYDVAFGGRDVSHPDPSKHRWYESNFAGTGFHTNLDAKAVDGHLLPSTERPDDPIKHPTGNYQPMAFGAVGRAWQPRAKLAGTYDQKWLDGHYPFLAPDFDERYYQAAPADQQYDYLVGGEEVALLNLTPEGRTHFVLPTVRMPVTFYPADGGEEGVCSVCDTLLIEPDAGRFTMTWRASRRLKRSVFELSEAVVGQGTRARERARRSGKRYYRSLRELRRPAASDGDED